MTDLVAGVLLAVACLVVAGLVVAAVYWVDRRR